MQAVINEKQNVKKVSLSYLFFTFFKIGLVSFGGHMALITVVQREMVDKDEIIDNHLILDAVGLASLLPGPLAVNVVTYIGYFLKGSRGAAVSMFAILLPACMLMLVLSCVYFTYAYNVQAKYLMYFVSGTVAAIVISTGINLFKKEVSGNALKIILCIIAIITQLLLKSYLVTIGLIILGGIAGILLKINGTKHPVAHHETLKNNFKLSLKWQSVTMLVLLLVCELSFISNSVRLLDNIYLKIGVVFSGISLSLFGGGYVMIPIMQSLFVSELQWLNPQEFIDAIAFSQITPGPILVSATFIGYKLAGITGALLATLAIFIPSAILMIIVSSVFLKNKEQHTLQNMLGGIKAVVIGLIITSGFNILQQIDTDLILITITLISFILSYRYKISPVYLILASIVLGAITKISL
ncbi:chromate efflux transporter [Pseudopedobacter beijingensis]|uniref:Chromate efflux transporter n=1 Tax=Pseudopedobacter beijingensis TaxID=1207056 RepID=A0ABW4I8V4_9SPHI